MEAENKRPLEEQQDDDNGNKRPCLDNNAVTAPTPPSTSEAEPAATNPPVAAPPPAEEEPAPVPPPNNETIAPAVTEPAVDAEPAAAEPPVASKNEAFKEKLKAASEKQKSPEETAEAAKPAPAPPAAKKSSPVKKAKSSPAKKAKPAKKAPPVRKSPPVDLSTLPKTARMAQKEMCKSLKPNDWVLVDAGAVKTQPVWLARVISTTERKDNKKYDGCFNVVNETVGIKLVWYTKMKRGKSLEYKVAEKFPPDNQDHESVLLTGFDMELCEGPPAEPLGENGNYVKWLEDEQSRVWLMDEGVYKHALENKF